MEKVILFNEGTKGLSYSDGKRMYFPDRKFEASAGVFYTNVSVTVDKDTYAFVKADVIIPESIFVGTLISKTIKSVVYDKLAAGKYSNVFVHLFGDYEVLHLDNEFYIMLNGELVEVFNVANAYTGYMTSTRETFLRSGILSVAATDVLTTLNFEIMFKSYLSEDPVENMLRVCKFYTNWKNKIWYNRDKQPKIYHYRGVIFKVIAKDSEPETYFYNPNKNDYFAYDAESTNIWEEVSDYIGFMKEHHISTAAGLYDEKLVSISYPGGYLKAFNLDAVSAKDLSDPELLKEIEDSFADFDIARKSACKHATAKTVVDIAQPYARALHAASM